MGFSTEGFVTVEAEKNPTWNCLSVKNATEGLPATKLVAGETSWIAGYYLGMKQIQGKKPDGSPSVSTIHTLQLIAVGDANHLSEPVAVGEKVQFFGKSSLDKDLIEKAGLGHAVYIKWLGLQPNKSNPAMPYHGFDFRVHPTDKIDSLPEAPNASVAPETLTQTAGAPSTEAIDDMPF